MKDFGQKIHLFPIEVLSKQTYIVAMNNIKLNYLYRDKSNYKNYGYVIFAGEACDDLEDLKSIISANLIDSTWFYADDWNLPDLHFDQWNNSDDHNFHEYESIEYTNEPPTTLITLAQFKNQLRILGHHEL